MPIDIHFLSNQGPLHKKPYRFLLHVVRWDQLGLDPVGETKKKVKVLSS